MRATISTSPFTAWDTYRNASLLPQTSAPAPATVNVPFANDALPATPVDPMSDVIHGDGTPAGGTAACTVRVAALLVTDPPLLLTVTEYAPAFADCALAT